MYLMPGRRGAWAAALACLAALLALSAAPAAATGSLSGPIARQGGATIVVDGPPEVRPGEPAVYELRASNVFPGKTVGSISVTIEGSPSIELAGASAPGARIFQPGAQMYSFAQNGQIVISQPVAELFVSSWPTGVQHSMRLRVTSSAPYRLLARASFGNREQGFSHLPPSGDGRDQQGAPVRAIARTPRQAAPPTNTPAPPPTNPPPPPATHTPAPPPTAAPPPPTAAAPAAAPAAPTATQTVPAAGQAKPTQPPAAPSATSPPPASTSAPAASSSDGGVSVPMLLAGVGIVAIGIAVGLVAVVLVMQRRTAQPAPPLSWPTPTGPYQPPGPYGPAPYPQYPPGTYGPGTPQPPTQVAGSGPGAPPWSPTVPNYQPGPAPAAGPSGAAGFGSMPGAGVAPGTPAPPGHHQTPYPGGAAGPYVSGAGSAGSPHVGAAPGAGGVTPTGERYVQRVRIGGGGMGSVFRAYDTRLRRWVALKIMNPELAQRPGFVERFIREAQVAAILDHPNIVTMYDVEAVGNTIQMTMSLIEGEDLQHILEREGALTLERAAGILDQVAGALDHAHLRPRPVLHRDIKPSNIMVAPGDRAILTDFGIARLIGDVSLTQTGQMVGTPAFMAPEVIQGGEADARADIYALGTVLYHMVTGRGPFRAETPLALLHAQINTPPPSARTIAPMLSPAVDDVLMRSLSKRPEERFQTAGELARAFRGALASR